MAKKAGKTSKNGKKVEALEVCGVVRREKGKLVLTVASATAANKFAGVVKKLSTGAVDLIKVEAYGVVVCHITRPLGRRLRPGKVTF